jgi:hypothetical protein
MRVTKGNRLLWSCVLAGLLLVLAAGLWVRTFHHRLPPGLMKDIRAGIAARQVQDPDARLLKYLEERYGPMSESAHRREAFLDFFNVDHIQALRLLVRHSPEAQRQANIDAMARWIGGFGAALAPEERVALSAYFQTDPAQAMLRRATAQYNSQDVRYRVSTAPVISQLLRTLHDIEQAR